MSCELFIPGWASKKEESFHKSFKETVIGHLSLVIGEKNRKIHLIDRKQLLPNPSEFPKDFY